MSNTIKLFGLDVRQGAQHKRGEDFYMCCPFCEKNGLSLDVGFKLGFNLKKQVYHCYRCGAKGRLKDIKELALLADYQEEISTEDLEEILHGIGGSGFGKLQTLPLDQFSVPIDPHATPIAYSYMIDRGYSYSEMQHYKIRVGVAYEDPVWGRTVSKWRGRVIFPYFYENECIYAVGRSHVGHPKKYINPPLPKGLVVYGLDAVTDNKAILCEGIISAHAAQRSTGVAAVAVLGKDPLPIQLARLRTRVDVVYKSLDGDVDRAKNDKVNRSLLDAGFEVWEVRLPEGEDPDSLGAVRYRECFSRATPLLGGLFCEI